MVIMESLLAFLLCLVALGILCMALILRYEINEYRRFLKERENNYEILPAPAQPEIRVDEVEGTEASEPSP